MAWILPDSVVADVASLPVTPLDGFEATVGGNPVRYSTASAKWVPTAPRRLAQLPYDALVDDVEVFVTNVRCPDGRKFAKYEGHWIDPALPLECPTCGQSQIVDPATGGTRHVINTAAELDALKAAASIAAGDVVHLRHPDGGTGAQIADAFDLRGNRVTGRANPMPNGTPGKPIRFTADPDVLIRPAITDIAIDVGEVDHIHVENVSITGGFSCIRYGGTRGTAEHYCRIGHVELRESDESAHLAIQAWNSDITEWSAYIKVLCPKLGPARTDTANPQETEFIYAGSGDTATIGQDKTHHIEFHNVDADGSVADVIELKRGVTDIYMSGKATNTNYLPAGPSGGGGQGVLGLLEPGANYATDEDDANVVVDGFVIDGYNDLYAVAIGQGGITVRNLVVSNASGAAAANPSIRVRSVAPFGTNATGSERILVHDVKSDAATVLQTFDPAPQQFPYVVDWTAIPADETPSSTQVFTALTGGASATNNTATLATALSGTMAQMAAGLWALNLSYRWRIGSAAQSFIGSFTFDGVTEEIHRQEPKDPNAAQLHSYFTQIPVTIPVGGATPAFLVQFGRTGNNAEISEVILRAEPVSP